MVSFLKHTYQRRFTGDAFYLPTPRVMGNKKAPPIKSEELELFESINGIFSKQMHLTYLSRIFGMELAPVLNLR